MSTDLLRQQLGQLSETLFLLQRRVRQAVAGEIGEAVANALAEVVTASLSGQHATTARRSYPTYSSYPTTYARSDWDDDESWDEPVPTRKAEVEQESPAVPTPNSQALFLVLLSASRALATRQTLTWATLGLGLGTGLATLYGGPLLRTALSLWWSVERLRSSSAALGDSAHLLERV